jgi:hypothetical protein
VVKAGGERLAKRVRKEQKAQPPPCRINQVDVEAEVVEVAPAEKEDQDGKGDQSR